MVEQLRPVTRPRLYEVIVEQLCAYMADNEMTPGDRLPAERDLAANLGVSRASLSQALVALEVQGVLSVRHGDGAILVRRPTEERAIKALRKAIAKNAASPFVARSLSRLYEAKGEVEAGRKTLQDALKVLPGDKWLNATLARLLDRNFPDEGNEAEACWRRSFTEGDTNYTSQFWFARRLYLNGKIDEALEHFARLKLARVPRNIKVSISGRIRENGCVKEFEGVIARLEGDYAWITPYGQQRSIYLSWRRCGSLRGADWGGGLIGIRVKYFPHLNNRLSQRKTCLSHTRGRQVRRPGVGHNRTYKYASQSGPSSSDFGRKALPDIGTPAAIGGCRKRKASVPSDRISRAWSLPAPYS